MYVIFNSKDKIVRIVSEKTAAAEIIGVSVRTFQRHYLDMPYKKDHFAVYYAENGVEKPKRGRNGILSNLKPDKKPWHNSEF